jgi:aspartyl/asparaginyl-tRNA synthetase
MNEHARTHLRRRTEENETDRRWYLQMLKEGVSPSAGFGISVEILARWIYGLATIWKAVPFPKVRPRVAMKGTSNFITLYPTTVSKYGIFSMVFKH